MAIAIQWLVRNFELWATIAGIVQVAGKPPFLKVLADIEDKKHSLINTVVGEMVPSICTENNQIILTSLTKHPGRHSNLRLFTRHPEILKKYAVADAVLAEPLANGFNALVEPFCFLNLFDVHKQIDLSGRVLWHQVDCLNRD